VKGLIGTPDAIGHPHFNGDGNGHIRLGGSRRIAPAERFLHTESPVA
jgi:hypothetical protein